MSNRSPATNRRCTPTTTDLEDGHLRKMLASPLNIQGREEISEPSRAPEASGKPEAMEMQERGASAQRSQADHSRRESLMSSLSQEPTVPVTPETMFSIFKHADPSNLGRSLLEGKKDHLLSQARSEFMNQEHSMGSVNRATSLCSKIGNTIPPEINSNDFGVFWNQFADSNSNFFVAKK